VYTQHARENTFISFIIKMKQGREREKKERHKRRRLLTGKLHEKSRKEMERHTVAGGRGAGGGDIL
jgi:hypothetical protein